MRTRLIIGATGAVLVAVLIGLILLIDAQQRSEEASRRRLRESLTQAAQVTAYNIQEQTRSAALTWTRTASPSPTLTVSPESAGLPEAEIGFSLTVVGSPVIAADGTSEISLRLTTFDPALVGRTVIFVPYGGGEVNPPMTTLPVDQDESIRYRAGHAAATIRIDAVLNDTGERTSVTIQTTADYFLLTGAQFVPEQDPFDPIHYRVPVTLGVSSTTEQIMQGQYNVDYAARGGWLSTTGTDRLTTYSYTFSNASTAINVYFIPDPAAQSGSILGNVRQREDVMPLDMPIYWNSAATRLTFDDRGTDNLSPDTRYQNSAFCLYSQDANGIYVHPNMLRLRYKPVLRRDASAVFVNLGINGAYSNPGVWLSTYTGDLRPFLQGSASCFSVQFNQGEGGLIQLDAESDTVPAFDVTYALVYYAQSLFRGSQARRIALYAGDGSLSAAMELPAGQSLLGYNLVSQVGLGMPVMLPLFVEPRFVDTDRHLLATDGQSPPVLYGTLNQFDGWALTGNMPNAYVLPLLPNESRHRVYVIASADSTEWYPYVPVIATEVPPPTFTQPPLVTPLSLVQPTLGMTVAATLPPTLTAPPTLTQSLPTATPQPSATPVPPSATPVPPTETPIPVIPTEAPTDPPPTVTPVTVETPTPQQPG